MKPVINFKGYSIEKLIYTKKEIPFTKELTIHNGMGLNLSIECGITDDLKLGKVSITVQLKDEKSNLSIITEIIGHFEINNRDNLDDIKNFLSVNGTAILYPYVRSIISIVSSLDSKEAIVLPTINTSMFAD